MSRYTLQNRETNIPYSKITQGRKWVGRVYPKADGSFGAVIGNGEHVTAPTRVDAFELVVARHCGFASADALKLNNRQVNASNRASKAMARAMFNDMMNGTSEQRQAAFDKFLSL